MAPDPNTPPTALTMAILLALAEGDLHGYGLMQAIEEQSDGRLTPGTGSLYAALDRLVGTGLIDEAASQVHDGRHRKAYRLTDDGRALAADEVQRMMRVIDAARERRIVGPDGEALGAGGRA